MKTMRTLLWPLVMLATLCSFGSAIALADASSPTSGQAPQNLASLWPMIGVLVATFAGWLVPKLASEYTFFHTGWGAVVLGSLGAVIGGVSSVLQAGTVTWAALAWAAISAATTFFARLNPSTTKEDPPVKSPAAKLGMLLPLVFLTALFGIGCAPGTDGLRQACANANVTLAQTTVTGTALYRLGHQDLRDKLTKTNADATEAKAKAYDSAFDKFIAAVQGITSAKTTVCDAADLIDAGAKLDVTALSAQAGKIVIDAAAALADLQKIIDTSQKTSHVNRRIALAGGLARAAVL